MPRRAGFTLIELLSVVVIFALLAGIAIPNLGLRKGRALDDESRRLAATMEFARQRAVMTGVPHRIVFDVEGGAYWLEWWASEAEAFGEGDAAPAPAAPGDARIEMAPPRGAERSFRPVLGSFGSRQALDADVLLASVETPEGVFEGGEVLVVFERDGTSEPTVVELATDDGDAVFLHLLPLADTVRFERVRT